MFSIWSVSYNYRVVWFLYIFLYFNMTLYYNILHYTSNLTAQNSYCYVTKTCCISPSWLPGILNSRHILYVSLGPVYVCSTSSSSPGFQQSVCCQWAGYETYQSCSQIVPQMYDWLASSSFDVMLDFLDSMSIYLRWPTTEAAEG